MTNGHGSVAVQICPRCHAQVQAGDNFCPRCRLQLAAPQGPTEPRQPVPEGPYDGTTRYLCAAAQLDQGFADQAIAEYLVERVRAVPPSPGVNAAAVLREAVAARARRRLRDGILLGLLIALCFVSLTTVIVWLVVGLVAAAAAGVGDGRRRATGLAVGLAALLLAVVLVPSILGLGSLLLLFSSGYGYGYPSPYGSSGTSGVWLLLGVFIVLALFAVLLADAVTVNRLVRERFRRGTFVPDHQRAVPSWERSIRGLGHQAFGHALARVAAADAAADAASRTPTSDADVIVHRGSRPFIGAGKALAPQILALPLDPADGAETPDRISVVDLHSHVAQALTELKATSSLAPERRLEGLHQQEQVLVPAEQLVVHRGAEPAVLPDLERPPLARLSALAARQLAEWPREWARYYRCYRIESWERELTTSCYFYAGTDQHMLYLEWTHCVLPPIQPRFRSIDFVAEPGSGPGATSITALLLLPTTVLRRIGSVFHRFVPIVQRYGEVVPERYGASRSLRELAADDDVQTYFQAVDAIRYVKIVDAALFRAVGDFLEQRGYSVVEFQKLASATINNTVTVTGGTHIGGTVGAGVVTGGGTTSTGSVRGAE